MHKFTSVTQVPPSMAVTMVAVPYLLMELNVHSNLLQLIRDEGKWGGMGTHVLPPTRYFVTTRMTLH